MKSRIISLDYIVSRGNKMFFRHKKIALCLSPNSIGSITLKKNIHVNLLLRVERIIKQIYLNICHIKNIKLIKYGYELSGAHVLYLKH